MIGAHRVKRTVDLHEVGLRRRAEDRAKLEVPTKVITRVVGSDQLRRLTLGHLANHWTKFVMFVMGSGNQAPDVFGSRGETRELQRKMRELKRSTRMWAALGQKTPNQVLCDMMKLLAEGQVGNCNDNAQAAAVFLAAFMPPADGEDRHPDYASLPDALLKEPELGALAKDLGDLVDLFLPPSTELHVIEHPEMPDHAQVFMATREAFAANNDAEVVVVDSWLVLPLVHLKCDESHGHRYPLGLHPLVVANAEGNGTRADHSITRHDPAFAQTARQISEAGRDRANPRRNELLQSPERKTWMKKHSGPDSGVYDGTNWAVRRSYKVQYKESENSEPVHFYDYDLDEYFDKRLKMLLVDHFRLLHEESALEELPYTGGGKFSEILDELADGDPAPLLELLGTLPPSMSSSRLLTDLLVLGFPDTCERESVIHSLCRHCMMNSSTPPTGQSRPIEQEVLNSLIWGIVSSHNGQDMHLLPVVLAAIENGLGSGDKALARRRAMECPSYLMSPLEKDLLLLAAGRHWQLKAMWSPTSGLPCASETLRSAAEAGHIGGVKFLLNGDWPDLMAGCEFLVSIAAEDNNWQVVQALVEQGATVRHCNSDGKTALHHAATHARLIDFVLNAGGDPNAPDSEGRTPAMHATTAKAMQAFVACADVDWSLTDRQGNSALLLAMSDKNRRDAALVLATMESTMVKQSNKKGEFPLLLATIEGDHPMLEALLANKVAPNQRDANGQTALMRAVLQADVLTVRLLLEHPGTDVEASNDRRETAFSICESLVEQASDEQKTRELIAIRELLSGRTDRLRLQTL